MTKTSLCLIGISTFFLVSCGGEPSKPSPQQQLINQEVDEKVALEMAKINYETAIAAALEGDRVKFNIYYGFVEEKLGKSGDGDSIVQAWFDDLGNYKDKVKQIALFSGGLEKLYSIGQDLGWDSTYHDFEKHFNALDVKEDEFEDRSIYTHKSKPYYSDNNTWYCYMITKGNNTYLRNVIRYSSEDWLFWNHFVLKAGDYKHKYFPSERPDHDNGSGDIWEWSDEMIDDEILEMCKEIIMSRECKIKFVGDKYYDAVTLKGKYIKGLEETLKACYYHLMIKGEEKSPV
ncbi:MAG: hypothetical protein ACI9J3_003753 [Parvicellaceae bacterium]|jgi:hypothetical protein